MSGTTSISTIEIATHATLAVRAIRQFADGCRTTVIGAMNR
jgi:hypothetical protein